MPSTEQATITIFAEGTTINNPPLPGKISFVPESPNFSQFEPVEFIFDQSLQTYITDDTYDVYLIIGGVARKITNTDAIVEYFLLKQDFTIYLSVALASDPLANINLYSKTKIVGDDPTSTTGEIIVRVG
ncbi:hypothetical protein [Alteromonas sp. a30]|uniref:hypothetical protein n=1 Tax=Alteromonas sp. a30 TaxID=2730917 RepID=UPI00227DBDD1|nr:hypothetical protein [Alteromonas sp. a30]MCY7294902.1 hypothetical protein [Alteromonas sp. a30]